jgi:hypothetical protein
LIVSNKQFGLPNSAAGTPCAGVPAFFVSGVLPQKSFCPHVTSLSCAVFVDSAHSLCSLFHHSVEILPFTLYFLTFSMFCFIGDLLKMAYEWALEEA